MALRALPASIVSGHVAGLAAALGGAWVLAAAAIFGVHMAYLWAALHPHSRGFGPVLRRLPASCDGVWLTIDDGPSDDTPALLDLLEASGARATFFLIARRARQRPELVREIVRRGHGLGNHTEGHPVGTFWLPRPAATAAQIQCAQRSLAEIAGVAPRWFRSPAGFCNPWVQPALDDAGLQRVSWSTRGFDAVDNDPARVFARIAPQLRAGAIVLLHEGLGPGIAVENLGRVLGELRRRGLQTLLPDAPAELSPAARRAVAG